MAEGLTQEEIDALMNLGLQSADQDDVEELPRAKAPAKPKESPRPTKKAEPSATTNAWAAPAFSTAKTPPRSMRRSSKLENPVGVQSAVFTNFDEEELSGETTNLEIILNLELEIRVELGKTATTVRDVLEMGPGSVLELQKLNGEPVDLMVNQKPFSKGEMIVIGENFGVRVTDILSITERIEALR